MTNREWSAFATVVGGKHIGHFTGTKEEAHAKAVATAHVSFCHECADECSDPSIDRVLLERESAPGKPWEIYDPDAPVSAESERAAIVAYLCSLADAAGHGKPKGKALKHLAADIARHKHAAFRKK